MAEYIGFIAAGMVNLCLIPQIIRVFKLKSAREISALFNIILLVGLTLYLVYGILLNLRPLIIWNAIGLILVSSLIFGKWKYGRQ
ncbi:SemiSWEET family sugar transporter [Chloroflexota bacterium]